MLPKVAIVGRPNVGKSSLLNLLAGRRLAIVDVTAGVTRDRLGTVIDLPATGEGRGREQIELIRKLGRSQLLSEDARIEVETFLGETPDKRQASEMIDRLKAMIDAQRKRTQSAEAGVQTAR